MEDKTKALYAENYRLKKRIQALQRRLNIFQNQSHRKQKIADKIPHKIPDKIDV